MKLSHIQKKSFFVFFWLSSWNLYGMEKDISEKAASENKQEEVNLEAENITIKPFSMGNIDDGNSQLELARFHVEAANETDDMLKKENFMTYGAQFFLKAVIKRNEYNLSFLTQASTFFSLLSKEKKIKIFFLQREHKPTNKTFGASCSELAIAMATFWRTSCDISNPLEKFAINRMESWVQLAKENNDMLDINNIILDKLDSINRAIIEDPSDIQTKLGDLAKFCAERSEKLMALNKEFLKSLPDYYMLDVCAN